MKQYLFSYGTLQPGLAPPAIAPVARRLRPIGTGVVHRFLFDLGKYPGAVLCNTGPRIWGRVVALPEDPEVLDRLDEYEGFNPAHPDTSEYLRKQCTVLIEAGKRSLHAWIYVYNRRPGSAPRIMSGVFSRSPD